MIRRLIERDVLQQNVASRELWTITHQTTDYRLFTSDLGGCPKKAYFNAADHLVDHPMHRERGYPFDDDLIQKFAVGKELEDLTAVRLQRQLGDDVAREWSIIDGVWAGRIDFLVRRCDQFPNGAIIEHKGTSHWNFKTGDKQRLPYDTHLLQTMAYKSYADKVTGWDVEAYIYYRVWDMWAEFEVWETPEGIFYDGLINGQRSSKNFSGLSLQVEKYRIEQFWDNPSEVQGYSDPFEARFGCTKYYRKKGLRQIACPYFNVCWPEYEVLDDNTVEEGF